MKFQVQISIDIKIFGDFFAFVIVLVDRVTSYMLLVGERWKVSRKISRGVFKLIRILFDDI